MLTGMPIGAAAPQSLRFPQRLSDKLLLPFHRVWARKDPAAPRAINSARNVPAQRPVEAPPSPDAAASTMKPVLPPVALKIRGLVKRFERPAVDVLNLSVPAGEFYTLLGPNGAGKTTTMRMVTGLLTPDHGSIAVFGIDALADPIGARRIMAWVSDEPMIYDKLTPTEYLAFVAGLWSIDANVAARRAQHLLASFGLEAHAHERCERLSRGMRQKVALAGALVHDPKLIILDEPLTGLDAGSARLIKGVLRERVNAGCSVIMTTHILEVAERMADRIGVMADGMLIAEGTLDELRCQAGSGNASLEDTFLALVAQGTAAG
ncbi:MAG TPA: ABC transporter ATP-binding protein [Acetobacteraceae bacterium]|nr:ABC transporter ATP-binding protein [Acetobacteraceae bacterium]